MSVIYVGCALLHASDESKQKVSNFKKTLKDQGHTVLEFVTNPNATNEEVYNNDIIECVGKCDLMIAFVDLPSTGLGFEMASALFRFKKPVIAVCHKDNEAKVSRLIRGIGGEVGPELFQFHTYEDMDSVADLVAKI